MLSLPKLTRLLLALSAVTAAVVLVTAGDAGTTVQPRLALVAPPAHQGILLTPSTLEEQTKRADLILVGEVRKVTGRPEAGTIVTDVTLEVEQYVKGDGEPTRTITIPGGESGSLHLYIGGVPNFVVGERTLLFLEDNAEPRLLQVFASKYALAGGDAIQLESETRLPLTTLGDRIGQALGRPVHIEEEDDSVPSIPFTTFCPAWAVSEMPVAHEANPSNPGSGGPVGNDFVRLVYASLNNWQALPDSHPTFSMTGATSNSGQSHFDRLNTVAWSPLGTGILGVNYCATQSGARIDSDTLISTNFTWDPDSSDGVSGFSLEAVLEHELGHGLGLGHSDQPCNGSPSTPLMCPAISSGGRKTILADDQAGAAFLYPLSGSAPGAPSSLQATAGSGSNSLSWVAGTGSTFATEIERSDSGCSGPFSSVQTVAASATSFVDDNYGDGLGAGTHCYRIKALGLGGDSQYSNTASVGQAAYGVTWGSHNTPSTITAGEPSSVNVSFTNSGSLTWPSGGATPVRLSYHWRDGACPGTGTAVWNGTRASLPGNIASGGAVSNLKLQLETPDSAGTYCLVYDLVHEGVTWFSQQGAATNSATVTVTADYSVSWDAHNTPSVLVPGETTPVNLTFTNTGTLTWDDNGPTPVRLSYHWRNGACPGTSTALWNGRRAQLPGDIAPGGTVSDLELQLPAPSNAGTYCLVYDLVRENVTWFSQQGADTLAVTVSVTGEPYGVSWGSHNTPSTMLRNSQPTVNLTFTNTGGLTWEASGSTPVRLSYHWRNGACPGTSPAVWNGRRATLPGDIAQGQTVSNLELQLKAPSTAGTYCLVYDLVHEHVTWFSQAGADTLTLTVDVTSGGGSR